MHQKDKSQATLPISLPLLISSVYKQRSSDRQITERLFVFARTEAQRIGLNHEDQSDCAITFVEKWFLSKRAFEPISGLTRIAARNHARDFRRAANLQSMALVQISQDIENSGGTVCKAPINSTWNPVFCLLASERSETVEKALSCVAATPKEFLLRRYFDNESVESIAVSSKRTPEAVRKILRRACERVRNSLLRQGKSQIDFSLNELS